ncbi:uncharacterized protein LOC116426369 [Nomia melanderi]|uniref:uncharacterized protein LOC116426369 n=1 Tax=Nomia melanderi TaxID=2448451 RepID=UPI001303FA16|nr:tetra-peptide repeat homeobox protein 1-like [Nomia melanderi]
MNLRYLLLPVITTPHKTTVLRLSMKINQFVEPCFYIFLQTSPYYTINIALEGKLQKESCIRFKYVTLQSIRLENIEILTARRKRCFQILSLLLVVSTAIRIDKRDKENRIASKKHDKRGLVNLGYGLPPEQLYGAPEPAPVYEAPFPDGLPPLAGHLEAAAPPVPPPAVVHPAPAVPVPVPHPFPQPVAVPVPQPVPHPFPVAVPVAKHVPVPVPVDRAVPVPVDRLVPVPVAVPVPKPYPVHVERLVHVDRPVPVPVEKPIHVPVDRPVPVPVPVPKPYPVAYEKVVHVDRPYPVHVAVPYHVPKPYPVPVAVHAHKSHGWFKW